MDITITITGLIPEQVAELAHVLHKFHYPDEPLEVKRDVDPVHLRRILDIRLKDCELTTRTIRILVTDLKLFDWKGVIKFGLPRLKKVKGLGKTTIGEINDMLDHFGLHWGMAL